MQMTSSLRYGVVVLGNPKVLSRQALWNALLTHYKDQGCLVEGPLTNLKQSMVQLSRPKRTFDRGSFGVGGSSIGAAANRYQPTERVGDPYPQSSMVGNMPFPQAQGCVNEAQGQQGGGVKKGGGGGGGPASQTLSQHSQSLSQHSQSLSQTSSVNSFMPFSMPAYAIPSINGGGDRSGGGKGGGFSQGSAILATQQSQSQSLSQSSVAMDPRGGLMGGGGGGLSTQMDGMSQGMSQLGLGLGLPSSDLLGLGGGPGGGGGGFLGDVDGSQYDLMAGGPAGGFVDPATGGFVDPATGGFVDPATGSFLELQG